MVRYAAIQVVALARMAARAWPGQPAAGAVTEQPFNDGRGSAGGADWDVAGGRSTGACLRSGGGAGRCGGNAGCAGRCRVSSDSAGGLVAGGAAASRWAALEKRFAQERYSAARSEAATRLVAAEAPAACSEQAIAEPAVESAATGRAREPADSAAPCRARIAETEFPVAPSDPAVPSVLPAALAGPATVRQEAAAYRQSSPKALAACRAVEARQVVAAFPVDRAIHR